MRPARLLLLVVLVLAAGWAIHRFSWQPYRCHAMKPRILQLTERAYEDGSLDGKAVARVNLVSIRQCLAVAPHDVGMLLYAGINESIIGNHRRALIDLRNALRLDQRPEFYLHYGLSQQAVGDGEGARRSLAAAVGFNPLLLDGISDGLLRQQVHENVLRQQAESGSLLNNGDFKAASRSGSGAFQGSGPGPSSAAARWEIANGEQGLTRTALRSAPPGGPVPQALYVDADCAYCGVVQNWAPAGTGPARTSTTVAVYVESGRVMIGTGDLGRIPAAAISSTTGQWELLTAPNGSCPANTTVIYSYDAPARFYVAAATVQATPGAPCDETASSGQ